MRAFRTWTSTASTPRPLSSLGLFAGAVRDPAFAAAMCRAYNRWLADYCKPYPTACSASPCCRCSRSSGASGDALRRKELGFRGGFLRPNPYNDRKLHSPDYEPFWREAEEIDFCIGITKAATAACRPSASIASTAARAAHHLAYHGDDAGRDEHDLGRRVRAASRTSRRLPGIGRRLDRPWLDRMDRHFDDKGFNDSGLKIRPSELFQRNCWISFEPVEGSIGALAEYIGPHKILWATDYPHRDGFFPGAPTMMKERIKGLSSATQHGIMAGGAMGFYGLN